MSDLRLLLAVALGLSPVAAAHEPPTEIPETSDDSHTTPASEAPVSEASASPSPVPVAAPAGCVEALGAARCDVQQLIGAEAAIVLAYAAWELPVEPVRARAMLALPTKDAERATGHLVYRVSRHDGGGSRNAVVDAETGVVLEHFVAYVRRGRPLMGMTGPVRAPLLPGDALSPLAKAWADAALDEAASVRAFEVHAEELRQVGAPVSFVERALVAADDERRHADAAFVLASRFAGRSVTPGALPAHAPARNEPFAVAHGVLLEGCLNETLALAEVREALRRCVDEAVREALIDVVREETQHAQLAFETLRWLLPRLSAGEREALRAVVLAYEAPSELVEVPDGFGVLPSSVADDVRRTTLDDVLRPLLLTALAEVPILG
jgi:hypothetical protein